MHTSKQKIFQKNKNNELFQMGILYNSVQLQKHMQKEMVMERLQELGVTHTREGKYVKELEYKELLSELVLAEMRQVDIDHPEHKWFR